MLWLKRLAKILLALLGIMAVFLLVFVGINLFDEDLNPEAKPWLDVPAMALAPEKNGYLYLLGFNAAADKNPHAVGMEIEKIIHAHYRNRDAWMTAPKINETVTGRAVSIPHAALDKICDVRKQPCLDRYLSESAKITKLAQENALILKRYRQLTAYPGFEDRPLYSITDHLPAYGGLSAASRLNMIMAAQQVAAGRHREGMEAITNDIRFWRQMLAGSKILLSKMIATRRIDDDLKLLNELIARYPAFARDQAAQLAEITRPLSAGESEFCGVLNHEMAIAVRHVHTIGQSRWKNRKEIRETMGYLGSTAINLQSMVAPIGFLPNASVNLIHDMNTTQAAFCTAKPAMLATASTESKSRLDSLTKSRTEGLALLYNPLGKLFMGGALIAYEDYRYRLIDTDGYLRATALHARIRAAGVGDNAVPGLIASAGATYHDPYTDKPIAWDAKARTLTVTWNGKPKQAGGVMTIKLGR